MLFTDANFATLADLSVLDPDVQSVIGANKLTLDSVAFAAWRAADRELSLLYSVQGDDYSPHSMPRRHVVVGREDRTTHVGYWLDALALVELYRQATRGTSDRYADKFAAASALVDTAKAGLRATGLPVVNYPLVAPGAAHEVGVGTFDSSLVAAVAGGSGATEAQYAVAITWAGTSAESGGSTRVGITVPAGQRIQVSITGLVPPAGQVELWSSGDAVLSWHTGATTSWSQGRATGWNVYAGLPGGVLYKQNASPNALSTATYTFEPVLSGSVLGAGQIADRVVDLRNFWR